MINKLNCTNELYLLLRKEISKMKRDLKHESINLKMHHTIIMQRVKINLLNIMKEYSQIKMTQYLFKLLQNMDIHKDQILNHLIPIMRETKLIDLLLEDQTITLISINKNKD